MSIDERINQVYNVSPTKQSTCLHESCCHDDDLKGEDFGTLENPVENTNYSSTCPGWLNDKIVDTYN